MTHSALARRPTNKVYHIVGSHARRLIDIEDAGQDMLLRTDLRQGTPDQASTPPGEYRLCCSNDRYNTLFTFSRASGRDSGKVQPAA